MTTELVPDTNEPGPVDCDLDTILAEADERPPFTFRFDGETYTLPPDLDLRSIAAFEGDRLDDGLRLLLGPDQWERLQKSPKAFTNKHLDRIGRDYAKHRGEDLGESEASAT